MSDFQLNFIVEFNDLVKKSQILLSIDRDSKLQQEACENLGSVLPKIAQEKKKAIENNDEDYANRLLGCECVANSLLNELQMWLMLKQEEPEKAWNHLCNAQMEAVHAGRAHDSFQHLEQHNHRLEEIEQTEFPSRVFVSPGIIVHKQECSICSEDYDECEHLAGIPYMGEFCCIIARDATYDHWAIVKNPADKRAALVKQ